MPKDWNFGCPDLEQDGAKVEVFVTDELRREGVLSLNNDLDNWTVTLACGQELPLNTFNCWRLM